MYVLIPAFRQCGVQEQWPEGLWVDEESVLNIHSLYLCHAGCPSHT